jgi:hypothetical protein
MRLRRPLVALVAAAALATAGGTLTACGDPLADTQQEDGGDDGGNDGGDDEEQDDEDDD